MHRSWQECAAWCLNFLVNHALSVSSKKGANMKLILKKKNPTPPATDSDESFVRTALADIINVKSVDTVDNIVIIEWEKITTTRAEGLSRLIHGAFASSEGLSVIFLDDPLKATSRYPAMYLESNKDGLYTYTVEPVFANHLAKNPLFRSQCKDHIGAKVIIETTGDKSKLLIVRSSSHIARPNPYNRLAHLLSKDRVLREAILSGMHESFSFSMRRNRTANPVRESALPSEEAAAAAGNSATEAAATLSNQSRFLCCCADVSGSAVREGRRAATAGNSEAGASTPSRQHSFFSPGDGPESSVGEGARAASAGTASPYRLGT